LPCKIISGGQWGDEGKGKISSFLSLKDEPTKIGRAGVGPNAGHTVELEEKNLDLERFHVDSFRRKLEF